MFGGTERKLSVRPSSTVALLLDNSFACLCVCKESLIFFFCSRVSLLLNEKHVGETAMVSLQFFFLPEEEH